jgi:hypothetical protein
MRAPRLKPCILTGIASLTAVVWAFATAFGFRELMLHENSPGQPSEASAAWPLASGIARSTFRATLVMIVHPQCSCTSAALGELALIKAQAPDRADVHVLFFKPAAFSKDFVQNDLWRAAARIPGVDVRIDDDGNQARLFHATTSGAVLLYDRDGRLIFEGGITASRSHSGDNAGRSAVVALLNGGRPARNRTFVFGCSILDSRKPGDTSK